MTELATTRRRGRGARRIVLTAHLVTSLGWLGLDIVLLTLAVHAAVQPADRHSGYLALHLLLDTLLLPLGLSSIATGMLLMRLGRWSYRRDYWAGAKLAIGIAGTAAAWFALRPVAAQALTATAPGTADPRPLYSGAHAPGTILIIAPTVACLLYLTATVLGIYKPARPRRRAPGAGLAGGPVRPGGSRREDGHRVTAR